MLASGTELLCFRVEGPVSGWLITSSLCGVHTGRIFFFVGWFYWSRFDLQCCDRFCCTVKWFNDTCPHIHSLLHSFPIWVITHTVLGAGQHVTVGQSCHIPQCAFAKTKLPVRPFPHLPPLSNCKFVFKVCESVSVLQISLPLSFFKLTHRSDIIWCLSFSVWLTWLSVIISSSIHVAAKSMISFFFYDLVVFHCVYVPHLLYPFLCWWALRLLPCLGCRKQCCYEL